MKKSKFFITLLLVLTMFVVFGEFEQIKAGWWDDLMDLNESLSIAIGGRPIELSFKARDARLKLLTTEELTELANQGNVDAQFNLGMFYFNNVIGSELDEKLRRQTAVNWFMAALMQGDSEAASMMGIVYVDSEYMSFRKDSWVYRWFYLAYLLDKSPQTKYNIDIWEESTLWGLGWQVIPEDEIKKGRAKAEELYQRTFSETKFTKNG